MKITKATKQQRTEDKFAYLGLLGVAFIILLTILGQTTLDASLTTAVYCLALSIPFLVVSGYIVTLAEVHDKTIVSPMLTAFGMLGASGAFGGIVAFIWHFSWLCGTLFLIVSAICLGVLLYANEQMITAQKNSQQ